MEWLKLIIFSVRKMNDIRNKYVSPSISKTAFNCPHCDVLAKQSWHSVHLDELRKDQCPLIWTQENSDDDKSTKSKELLTQRAKGHPFLKRNVSYREFDLQNVSVSQCYNCDEISVWIYDKMLWPAQATAELPNPDLPDDVREDYIEASTILALSPRGAAALLRLAIQKLCTHLGQSGKDLNDDIAALVKDGLDKRVQKGLDVVRVVGNHAVHPGLIDLNDNRETAEQLFELTNLIAEKTISEPKHVDEMFDKLPEGAKKAIEARDKKK